MLKIKNISKSYKTGDFVQNALKNINLEFRESEFVAILGPSGSGKTTLLNIIGGLDKYDDGDLIINNKSTKKYKNKDWDAYRNNCIGFIFQNYNLISHINILQNVEMGLTLSGVKSKKRRKKALELLERVGLKDHIHKKPNQLSGGQMQRVAIARALANDPKIILADEPTGALDSKTSVQIMELIKEIAKDKLVIMVTHNPELAKEYATRIIEFKDGNLISDSNPIKDSEKNNDILNIKKTKMEFKTALNLSFNNIKTKKGRTILTAFASSIGIIGIALVLALSNGFQNKIDEFEKNTLSQMPINIGKEVSISNTNDNNKDIPINTKKYSDEKNVYPLVTNGNLVHENKITEDYINYIKNIDNNLIGGLIYNRTTNLNILYKNNDKIAIFPSELLFPLPENTSGEEDSIITDNFEVIAGKMSKEYNELILLVDANNNLNLETLKALGYTEKEKVSFNDILNKEFKVILNNDYYINTNGNYMKNNDLEKLYKNNNNITLKITGIIRGKEDNDFGELSGTGLIYKEKLMTTIMTNNDNSDIVKKQKSIDYSLINGEIFNETNSINDTLALLGASSNPYAISIYPKDFNAKDKILKYLENYNKDKKEEDKILFTDYAEMISSLSGGIMNGITIVLVAFSAVSLIVSSIMIGIIIYISVLERTKEIGILKALGARKKDITRVFNAETFIIGCTSGIMGILITELLCIPINIIIKNLTKLDKVASLSPIHAIILILISITLTLIGGYIPAKIASKKEAVEALRTE